MSNLQNLSAILGLVALGAMTSCSVKEDPTACPKQQVFVDLRTFDYAMDAFTPATKALGTPATKASGIPMTKASSIPSTKASEASGTIDALAFKAFDSSGSVAYETTQFSGDTGFGTLSFELSPGSYTFVAVGHKNSSEAPAGSVASISSITEATLPGEIVSDTFSGIQAAVIQPRTAFSTGMTLPRVISKFTLKTTDFLPANVASIELIAKSDKPSAGSSTSANGSTFSSGTSGITFDPSDGTIATDRQFARTFDVSSAVGKTLTLNMSMLLTADEQSIPVTVNAYDASGTLVTTLTLNDVPLKRNRITTARGVLFTSGGSGTFSFETDWLAGEEMTF